MTKRQPKKRRRLRLEAEEICLVDSSGVERMTLMLDEDGTPSITLRDRKHRGRIVLALRSDDTSHISLLRESGHTSLGMGENSQGRVGVSLLGSNDETRVSIVVHPDDSPQIMLHDANGKTVWTS